MPGESVTIVKTTVVTNCHACPNIHNSSWDHDDPFTSAPKGSWYCKEGGLSLNYGFNVSTEIHKQCPLRKHDHETQR